MRSSYSNPGVLPRWSRSRGSSIGSCAACRPGSLRAGVCRFAIALLLLGFAAFAQAQTGQVAAGGHHSLALQPNGTLWVWGDNSYGQLGDGTTTDRGKAIPIGAGYTAIAAGSYHSVALKSDGSLWAWGYNNNGQLGDNSIFNRNAPKQIGAGYKAIAAGGYHTLAIKSDGSLWAWGDNYWGQLGIGTYSDSLVPKQVGLASNWVAVAAGTYFSVALDAVGGLWAWGYNSDGQLGNGTTAYRSTPLRFATGASAIATGNAHAIALDAGGWLYSWGDNVDGQLGDGLTGDRNAIYAVGSGYRASDPGAYHTLGLKTDGSLWAWGHNGYGQLGISSTSDSHVPVRVGTANDWVAISAAMHSLALKSDGGVWAWGYNRNAEVGNGSTLNQTSPTQVLDASGASLNLLTATASYTLNTSISGSGAMTSTPAGIDCGTTCSALYASGTAVTLSAAPAVGYRFTGWSGGCTGTGDCTVTMDQAQSVSASFDLIPVPAVGLSASSLGFANQVMGSASTAKTVTLTNTGTASLSIASIAASGDFTQTNDCGSARAAGTNCTINVIFAPSAMAPSTGSLTITSDASGSPHVVALSGTGVNGLSTISISGPATLDEGASSGYGIVASYADASTATVNGTFSLAATAYASLSGATLSAGAVTADRTVTLNASYSEGGVTKTAGLAVTIRNTGNLLTGIAIVGPNVVNEGASATYTITASYDNNSAATVTGSFSLTATPYAGVSGNTFTANTVPGDRAVLLNASYTEGAVTRTAVIAVQVKDLPSSASSIWKIAAGGDHTLVIKGDGSLWAWGRNNYGQLGDGTVTWSSIPKPIGTGFAEVAAGNNHSVALKADGTLWTWGYNYYGQLGDGGTNESHTPKQIGSGYTAIAAGYSHTLAIKGDGSLWAWGYNSSAGVLGDGSTTSSSVPRQVGTGFLAVAAGWSHTHALKTDGSLWAWGDNTYGQLGDGSNAKSAVPKQIGSGYVSVSARGMGAIAVKADGTLWEWGKYDHISLEPASQGAVTSSISPRQMGSGFVAVEAGHDHNLALKADDTLWVWGNNYYGQLANGGGGYGGDSMTPRQIEGNYLAVGAGYGHTIALKSDGSLSAWGYNASGQLGNNATQNLPLPVAVFLNDLMGTPDRLRIEAPVTVAGGSTEFVRAVGVWGTVTSPISPVIWSIASGNAGAVSESGVFIAKPVAQEETVVVRATFVTPGQSVSSDQAVRVTAAAADTSPDPFAFNFITVSMNTWCNSNEVLITGTNAPAIIRVENGYYSTDGGTTWSDAPGTVAPGAKVGLRTMAPAANELKRVTAYIGDQVGVFGVSTFGSSGVPAPIDFAGQTGVAADTDVDSAQSDPVASISTAAAISVSGPGAQYSINGGAYTSAAGALNPSERVSVRLHSSPVAGETVTATLNIGGMISTFNATTAGASASTQPDPFAFAYTQHSSVALSSLMYSNTIVVSGLVAPTAAISVAGGEYSLNRGPWTSAEGTVKNGDRVALRVKSADSNSTPTSVLVNIGGVVRPFNVTTAPAGGVSNIDDTPSPFPFPPQTGVAPGAQAVSSAATVLGISHGTAVKVSGGEYRIVNSAANIDTGFVDYEAYVELGDEVSVRHTASTLPLTTTTATLNIGTRSEVFSVTTGEMVVQTTTTTTAPSTTTTTEVAITTTTEAATTTTTAVATTTTTTVPVTTTTAPSTTTTTTTSTTLPTTTTTTSTSSTTLPTTSTTTTASTAAPSTTTTATTTSTTTPTSTSTTTTTVPDTITSTVATTTTTSGTTTTTLAAATLNLTTNWNLVGNSSSAALDVAAAFADTTKVTTVWKWIANGAKWAFYAPSLVGEALADYAASKGYEVLTFIESGAGFWVNARTAFTAQLPAGAAIASDAFQSKLVAGWNLIATGDGKTPSQFNRALSSVLPAEGDIPVNLITLWAWDALLANWYFYAPSLEKNGGLTDYVQQKSYLEFGSKVLDPTTGFWVNRPQDVSAK